MPKLSKIVPGIVLFFLASAIILFFVSINGQAFGFDKNDGWAFLIYAFMSLLTAAGVTFLYIFKKLGWEL